MAVSQFSTWKSLPQKPSEAQNVSYLILEKLKKSFESSHYLHFTAAQRLFCLLHSVVKACKVSAGGWVMAAVTFHVFYSIQMSLGEFYRKFEALNRFELLGMFSISSGNFKSLSYSSDTVGEFLKCRLIARGFYIWFLELWKI